MEIRIQPLGHQLLWHTPCIWRPAVIHLSAGEQSAATTDLIRALEYHRAQTLIQRQPEPSKPSLPLLLSWIHHDNMLEGRRFRTEEIAQALRNQDDEVVKYLRPLMARIRRYRDAILMVWNASHDGARRIRVDTLKRIHRTITPDPKDRGGEFRVSSPVHRDYFQNICAAAKVPYNLRKVLEFIQEEFDRACDPIKFAATAHHRLMRLSVQAKSGVTIRLFTNLVLTSRDIHQPSFQRIDGMLTTTLSIIPSGSVGSRLFRSCFGSAQRLASPGPD